MLSESAERVLEVLKKIPGGKLCVPCAGAQFDVDRHEVLRAMRELLDADHIIHDVSHCSCCGQAGLVAVCRPSRFQRSA
jgi:hypothetical protein